MLSYDASSVDSSAGKGVFRLTIREVRERRKGEASYVTMGGRRLHYDTVARQVVFDCPSGRFRAGGNEYFMGAVRLAGQDVPAPLSDWRSADQDDTVVRAFGAFCKRQK